MNRDEQIEKAGDKYFNEIYNNFKQNKDPVASAYDDGFLDGLDPAVRTAFIAGAEWADENPKIPIITMSEIEDVSKELITKDWKAIQDNLWEMVVRNILYKFTNKACEWLRLHMPFGEVDMELKDNIIDEFENFMKSKCYGCC